MRPEVARQAAGLGRGSLAGRPMIAPVDLERTLAECLKGRAG